MPRNINKYNPTSKDFGVYKPATEKELKEYKEKNRPRRKMKRIHDAKTEPDQFDTNMGVCWMCWMDITQKGLEEWRREPYSVADTLHDRICPLCGYSSWKGRVWYPFRFLRGYIGNPSARNGI